jgi:hypothetical protein
MYPVDAAPTRVNVEAKRKAEHNLDRFWRFVDNVGRKYTSIKQHKSIQSVLNEGGKLRRTALWVENSVSDEPAAPKSDVGYIPFSETDHDATGITGHFNRVTIAPKIKNKTRKRHNAVAVANIISLQHRPSQPQSLSTSSTKTLTSSSTCSFTRQTIERYRTAFGGWTWPALSRSLGFRVKSRMARHGNSPPQPSTCIREFIFTTPPPGDEVPLVFARRYEARLNRAYGWDGTMVRRR